MNEKLAAWTSGKIIFKTFTAKLVVLIQYYLSLMIIVGLK
jgi:hypothetical protein